LRIAITGASGFVGRHLVRVLSGKGHNLRLIVHRRRPQDDSDPSIEIVEGDVHNIDSLKKAFAGIDVVYHLVGLIVETKEQTFEKTVAIGTAHVVEACLRCGVGRIIYLSAAGTSPSAEAKYHQSKWKAEETVRNSGIDYVIFRPSVIFGEGDGFINMVVRMIEKYPVMPIVGDGKYQFQPVYIKDLASVMVDAPANVKALHRTIEVGGPDRLEYMGILNILKIKLNKKRANIHLPFWLMMIIASILERIMKPAPLTRDQLLMLRSGNICDNSQLLDIFNIKLTGFEDGLREYMR